jgi:hypothetical protein
MDYAEMEAYVAQVVDAAEATFGQDFGRTLLEAYAREAVLELWLTNPGIIVARAGLALEQIRDEIARRSRAATAWPSEAA